MDLAMRRNVGMLIALVGFLLLAAVVGVLVMDTFVWADPEAGMDYRHIGGGCCCGVVAGVIMLYGLLMAIMAARAA